MKKNRPLAIAIAAMTAITSVGAPAVTGMGTVYAGTTSPAVASMSADTGTGVVTPLKLSTTRRVIDTYVDPDDDGNYNNAQLIVNLASGCKNTLEEAESSNEEIVGAWVDEDTNTVSLYPFDTGTVVVKVTDTNGQTATFSVEVKSSYLYQESCAFTQESIEDTLKGIEYGNQVLDLGGMWDSDVVPYSDLHASVEVGGKRYTMGYNDKYEHPTLELPKLPVGTEYKYTVKVGSHASVTRTSYIQKFYLDLYDDDYCDGSRSIAKVTKNRTYNGKAQQAPLKVTVKYDALHGGESRTLTKGTDYTIKCTNNTSVGTARYTLTGTGNYTGTYKGTFRIVPKGTSIKKLTPGTKKMTVTFGKQRTQTSGYQVQYSTKSNFKSAKTLTIKSNTTTQKTVKNLSAHKKYYVRVRTYKTVKGHKYCSSWSAARTVTTK